jgi:hypothetical protein
MLPFAFRLLCLLFDWPLSTSVDTIEFEKEIIEFKEERTELRKKWLITCSLFKDDMSDSKCVALND